MDIKYRLHQSSVNDLDILFSNDRQKAGKTKKEERLVLRTKSNISLFSHERNFLRILCGNDSLKVLDCCFEAFIQHDFRLPIQ